MNNEKIQSRYEALHFKFDHTTLFLAGYTAFLVSVVMAVILAIKLQQIPFLAISCAVVFAIYCIAMYKLQYRKGNLTKKDVIQYAGNENDLLNAGYDIVCEDKGIFIAQKAKE